MIDCSQFPTSDDQKEAESDEESDEESTYIPQENELPISKDLIASNSNLFPRVETMKISFYEEDENFVRIPILFFQKYFSNTKCLSELQIQTPLISYQISSLSFAFFPPPKQEYTLNNNHADDTNVDYFSSLGRTLCTHLARNEKIQLKTLGDADFLSNFCAEHGDERHIISEKCPRIQFYEFPRNLILPEQFQTISDFPDDMAQTKWNGSKTAFLDYAISRGCSPFLITILANELHLIKVYLLICLSLLASCEKRGTAAWDRII